MIKDALAHLQIEVSKKKDDSSAEAMRKLRPLADRIYEEKKYKKAVNIIIIIIIIIITIIKFN